MLRCAYQFDLIKNIIIFTLQEEKYEKILIWRLKENIVGGWACKLISDHTSDLNKGFRDNSTNFNYYRLALILKSEVLFSMKFPSQHLLSIL